MTMRGTHGSPAPGRSLTAVAPATISRNVDRPTTQRTPAERPAEEVGRRQGPLDRLGRRVDPAHADRDGDRGARSSSPRPSATCCSARAAASSTDAIKQLEAAGCTVQKVAALPSGDHSVLTPGGTSKKWNTDPPTSGPHYQQCRRSGARTRRRSIRRRSCTTSSTAASSSSTARTCRRPRSTS